NKHRGKMEDRLHEAALYQRIFQTAVEGILVVDVQGTILKANAGCESIFGYHKNELVRKNIDLLIPGMIGKIRKDPGERAPKNAKSRFITKETALGGFKKNGAKIHLDIRISVGTTDGGPGTILFLH